VTALLWWHRPLGGCGASSTMRANPPPMRPACWWRADQSPGGMPDRTRLPIAGVAPAGHLAWRAFVRTWPPRAIAAAAGRPALVAAATAAGAGGPGFWAAAAVAVAISTTAWASPGTDPRRDHEHDETELEANPGGVRWWPRSPHPTACRAETAAPSPAPPPAESSPLRSRRRPARKHSPFRIMPGPGPASRGTATDRPGDATSCPHERGRRTRWGRPLDQGCGAAGVSDGSPPGSNCPSLTATGSSSLSYSGISSIPTLRRFGAAFRSFRRLVPAPCPSPTAPAAQRGASAPSASLAGHKSTGKERLEALLRSTVIDVGPWSGLPLSEVIRVLSDQSQRQDPPNRGELPTQSRASADRPGPAPGHRPRHRSPAASGSRGAGPI